MPNAILWKNPHIRFMKQELTIAVVLLAIGGLFWATSRSATQVSLQPILGSKEASAENSSRGHAVNSFASQQRIFNPSTDNVYSAAPLVMPANYQQPIVDANPSGAFSSAHELSPSPQSHQTALGLSSLSTFAAYLHSASNTQTVELLANVATQIENSIPFQSKLALRASVIQQDLVADGNYFQMGQGSRKTKIELAFDQLPGKPEILQLCDGRFVYTIHSRGTIANTDRKATMPRQKLEFVDLLRVKEATGGISAANQRFVSPTGGLATGGISSLLRNLASNFNFGPPEALDPNSERILIRGSWDETVLRRIILDFDDQIKLGSPVQWAKLPKHIPHAIEMILTRSLNQTYFPSQISYLRFAVKEHGATMEPTPTISMSFSTPQPLSNLAEGFFVLDSSKFDPTDRTDRYIAQIKFFRRAQEQIANQEDPVENSFIK